MAVMLLLAVLYAAGWSRQTQTAAPPLRADDTVDARPLPPIAELLHDVERNQIASEASRRDYTYHVHLEEQELSGKGALKKTDVTDSESVTINGVRVNRVVARDGKPLTPEQAQKESERIDKVVQKNKPRRVRNKDGSESIVTPGDEYVGAARILELGTFSNPRRVELNGRATIVADYAGDPNAQRRNEFEGMIRDLVGTVWIDEKDRMLVRAEGHFLNDFKVGGGLLLNVHKGLHFTFQTTKVNGEVWLPATVDAEGSARILLFGGINGRIHLVTSDYRKFRTSSVIEAGGTIVQPTDRHYPRHRPCRLLPALTPETAQGNSRSRPLVTRKVFIPPAPKAAFLRKSYRG